MFNSMKDAFINASKANTNRTTKTTTLVKESIKRDDVRLQGIKKKREEEKAKKAESSNNGSKA